jgi:tetratricopeptide (TPR) repeat protein
MVSEWMNSALSNREKVSPGVLLDALGAASGVAAVDFRNTAWLDWARLAGEMEQGSEDWHGWHLAAAVATNRLGRRAEAIALFDRVFAESNDPRMRASALIGKVQYETPRRAWELWQQARELSPPDSLWWDPAYAAFSLGSTALDVGEYDEAEKMADRSLELSRRWGFRVVEGQAAVVSTATHIATGRFDEATELMREAVPKARRLLGPNVTTSAVLLWAAETARVRGDLAKAHQYVHEARRVSERNDMERWKLMASRRQALITRDEGKYDSSAELLEAAVRRALDTGLDELVPMLRSVQASVELRREEPVRALTLLVEVLADPDRLIHVEATEALDMVAIALVQLGRAESATQLLGAADRQREETGLVVSPPDRPILSEAVARAQTMLEDGWDATHSFGRTLTLDEALSLARVEAESAHRPAER